MEQRTAMPTVQERVKQMESVRARLVQRSTELEAKIATLEERLHSKTGT